MHLEQRWLKSAFVNNHNTPPSILRQEPSKDVDAAWEYLHRNGRIFLITADEVERLGKDPKAAVIAPDEWREYKLSPPPFLHILYTYNRSFRQRGRKVHRYHSVIA